MRKGKAVLFGLAFWALTQAIFPQDKNLALLGRYSSLSNHIEKAKTAFRRGNMAKCEQEALFCLERLTRHHEAHFLMSQVLYQRGEFGKALEHIQAAEEGYLKLTEAVSLLEQQKLKEKTDSVASLFDDVQEYTVADNATKNRGSCQPDRYAKPLQDAKEKLIKEGRWDERDQGQMISQIPADYHYIHGNCLFRLKRLPEAEAAYLLAIKINPGYGEAYNNLINLLFMQKRLDEARACLSQAEAHKASIHPGLKKAVLETGGK
jgi:tetratricopeptide (TPR) repeat protein